MSTVISDGIALSVTDEVAGPPYGTLAGTEKFEACEPNPGSLEKFLAQLKLTARNPISNDLMPRKGKTTDLESGPSYAADLTYDAVAFWAPRSLFCKYSGPGKLTDGDVYRPTGVTATGYTVAASGDLVQNFLIYASGFSNPANNGLKLVGAGSTATEIKTSGLVVEAGIADSQNAQVQVCGFQFTAGDAQIDASGNFITGGGGQDLTATGFNLTEGQFIFIGGDIADATKNFATAADRGPARIAKGGVAAHLLTLNKKATTFTVDNGATKTIQVFWGRFARTVARTDSKYSFRTHRFEITMPDLGGVGVDHYLRPKGNVVTQWNVELPITSIGAMTLEFVGMDTLGPAVTRDTGASTFRRNVLTDSFNTSSEYLRLRVTKADETGLSTDILNATINVKTNAKGKRVQGTLGAKYLLRGTIEPTLDVELLFTDSLVATALRNNDTATCEFGMRNADGQGVFFDFPAVSIAEGAPDAPEHDLVSLKTTLKAFKDSIYGTVMSVSLFPYLPPS